MADYKLFIDGEFVDAEDGTEFETIDPSTGETIATVAQAGKADVEKAIGAARAAFDDGRWSGLKPEKRAAALGRGNLDRALTHIRFRRNSGGKFPPRDQENPMKGNRRSATGPLGEPLPLTVCC